MNWTAFLPAIAAAFIAALVAATSGLIAWHWALWKSHTDHKLHVSENYLRVAALDPIYRELRFLRSVVEEIAAKLRIQAKEGHD